MSGLLGEYNQVSPMDGRRPPLYPESVPDLEREPSDAPGEPGSRFRHLLTLGRGGLGVVELVWDSERHQRVALKRLPTLSAPLARRLKAEFRTASKLSHRNLVTLYELGQDDRGPFFTMEYVDGVDPLTYCTREDRPERFQTVVHQILPALAYIHGAGLVHRDLKPSNVLIDGDGVLKLLDFGLSTRSRADDSGDAATTTGPAGTPGYMAPEQARGDPVTSAIDLYALGVLLRAIADPAFSELVSETSDRLMRDDPEDRPTLDEVARLLEPVVGPVDVAVASRAQEIVGRDHELATLVGALCEPAPAMLVLRGPTGIGKSALLRALSERIRQDGGTVLRGAARPDETVAFNALDGVLDDVSVELLRDELPPDVRRAADEASRAFPVLADPARTLADREIVRFTVASRLFGPKAMAADKPTRFSTFDRVARVVAHVCLEQPTVALLDDLQWTDTDALALLDHLRRTVTDLRVVAALRDDVGDNPAARWLALRNDVRFFDVAPLADEVVEQIVRDVAGGAGSPDVRVSGSLIRTCSGRPAHAELLGYSLARRSSPGSDPDLPTGEGLLTGIVDELEALERAVLAHLLARDGWLSTAELAALLELSEGAVRDGVASLSRHGLVRDDLSAGELHVRLYHDMIAQAVSESVSPGDLARVHGRLADRLLRAPNRDPARLAQHLSAAGRLDDAAAPALEAARIAEDQYAYRLAAEMYTIALSSAAGSEPEIERAYAEALTNGALFQAAAERWSTLRRSPRARQHRELGFDATVNEAYCLLSTGRFSRGAEVVRALFDESGLHGTGAVRLLDAVEAARFLIGPLPTSLARARPKTRTVPVRTARRVQQLSSLVTLLDAMEGMRLGRLARDSFAEAKSREDAAQCEYTLAMVAEWLTGRTGASSLSARYRNAARRHLGDPSLRPRAPRPLAMEEAIDGFRSLRDGDWVAAAHAYDRSIESYDRAGLTGTMDQLYMLSTRVRIELYRQNLEAVGGQIERLERAVGATEGSQMATHLAYTTALYRIFQGRSEEARDALRATLDRLGAEAFTADLFIVRRIDCRALLYSDPVRGWRSHRSAQHEGRRFSLDRCFERGWHLGVAALLEAAALRLRAPGASARRIRYWAWTTRSACPVGAGMTTRAAAYAADAAGQPERALRLLADAERQAREARRPLDAAVARYQRGRRLGGSEGTREMEAARTDVERAGSSVAFLDEDPA